MYVDIWFFVVLPAVFNQLIHTSLTWKEDKREYYYNNFVLNNFVIRNLNSYTRKVYSNNKIM